MAATEEARGALSAALPGRAALRRGRHARRAAASLTVADLRRAARRRLPRILFDFVEGGAQEETTVAANRADLDMVRFTPRVLTGVANRSQRTTLFGKAMECPLIVAPTGLSGALWPRGEVAAAAGAASQGVTYCMSSLSTCPLEEVAKTAPGAWFQLYLQPDRGIAADLVSRAEAAGCGALCVTVDMAVAGRRDRDVRNGLSFPFRPRPGHVLDFAFHPRWALAALFGPPIRFANFPAAGAASGGTAAPWRNYFPAARWDEIDWLRGLWRGPLVVKGVLSPQDARRALDTGADAVVVSNHGGRQFDGVVSTIRALGPVAEAVAGRGAVLFDGGVRTGADVMRAVALGATACLVGRAHLYGLAAHGAAGVARALAILRSEIDLAQAMLGAETLDAMTRDRLAPAGLTGGCDGQR